MVDAIPVFSASRSEDHARLLTGKTKYSLTAADSRNNCVHFALNRFNAGVRRHAKQME
jgi:hypothetical protein